MWHRAVSTLSHLNSREGPASGTSALSNPFDVSSDSGNASPTKDESHSSTNLGAVLYHARAFTNGIEWQIAEGMFETTLSLARVYIRRGSVREAEYFIREAEQLASSLNAPALLCQALAMKVDVQLQLRQLDTALTTLCAARDALKDTAGLDAAGLRKLQGEHSELLLQEKDAQLKYAEALRTLEELDKMFSGLEAQKRHSLPGLNSPPSRRSSAFLSGPLRSKEGLEPPAPALFSAVLRQHSKLIPSGSFVSYPFVSLAIAQRYRRCIRNLTAQVVSVGPIGRCTGKRLLGKITPFWVVNMSYRRKSDPCWRG